MWLLEKESYSLVRWPGKAKLLVSPFLSKAGGYGTASLGAGGERVQRQKVSKTKEFQDHVYSIVWCTFLASVLLYRHQLLCWYRNRLNTTWNLPGKQHLQGPYVANVWRSSIINVSGSRWKTSFSCCKRPWRDVSVVFLFFHLPDTKPSGIQGLEQNKKMQHWNNCNNDSEERP